MKHVTDSPYAPRTSLVEMAWLAGILEGEGCFRSSSHQGIDHYPVFNLQMTDRDVVDKASSILRCRTSGPYVSRQKKSDGTLRKAVYRCGHSGNRAVWWMKKLLPLMGCRRRKRMQEIVWLWERNSRSTVPQRMMRAENGKRTMSRCHPDRVSNARGLCMPCYKKVRHASGIPWGSA